MVIGITKRGGESWWATDNPTYEGNKPTCFPLIHPEMGFCLAREFEEVFRKYYAIEMLEELGKKHILRKIDMLAADILDFS